MALASEVVSTCLPLASKDSTKSSITVLRVVTKFLTCWVNLGSIVAMSPSDLTYIFRIR